MLTEKAIQTLLKQQYRIIGNHSAVKICLWTKKDLKGQGKCYKHYFYGIETNKCLEMSPAILCNQRCKHCWRDTSIFAKKWEGKIDEPEDILNKSLKARKELLIGFKGNNQVDNDYLEQSFELSHVAISLTGEPCMYPKLPELIDLIFKNKAKTVFLVTSGTVPNTLTKLNKLPTNLYLSLETTNKKNHKLLCNPVIENAWENINKSMEILRKIPTRTVMRITCIKGMNMDKPEEFLESINKMQPDYIETKGYMFLGYSIKRMKRENMPLFEEVQDFAKSLAKSSNYQIVDDHKPSNIVLLKRINPRKEYSDSLYKT